MERDEVYDCVTIYLDELGPLGSEELDEDGLVTRCLEEAEVPEE